MHEKGGTQREGEKEREIEPLKANISFEEFTTEV